MESCGVRLVGWQRKIGVNFEIIELIRRRGGEILSFDLFRDVIIQDA